MNRHRPYQPNLALIDDSGKLIVRHSSGFFSCCTIRLRKIINYYNDYNKFPVVDSSMQWKMYKDNDGDITPYLFKIDNSITDYFGDVIFSKDTVEDQFSDYSLIQYDVVNKFIDKYFTVSDDIISIKNNLLNKYNIDVNTTIAICFRGGDKRTETNIPSHDTMIKEIRLIKEQYPNHKLLIQSDEIEFYNRLVSESIDFIQFHETVKVNAQQRAVQFHIPIGERLNKAQTFLAVMSILSSCDILCTNSGNVGMWLCLLRGSFNNVKQII